MSSRLPPWRRGQRRQARQISQLQTRVQEVSRSARLRGPAGPPGEDGGLTVPFSSSLPVTPSVGQVRYNPSRSLPTFIGPPGPPGPPGVAGTFTFTQSVAAATWIITHNQGRYPVPVVLVGGQQVYTDVTYVDENQLSLSFPAPTSGTAYL